MIRSTLTRAKCPHCGNEIMTAEKNIYNSEPIHRCYCGGEVVDGRCRDCGALMIDMSHFRGDGYESTILRLCVGGHEVDLFGVMRHIEVERGMVPGMRSFATGQFLTSPVDDAVRVTLLMSGTYIRG